VCVCVYYIYAHTHTHLVSNGVGLPAHNMTRIFVATFTWE
jgi:hypothetical protein